MYFLHRLTRLLLTLLVQIPDNAKLQKETVLSLVKGSTVFINYLGSFLVHFNPTCVSVLTFVDLSRNVSSSMDQVYILAL